MKVKVSEATGPVLDWAFVDCLHLGPRVESEWYTDGRLYVTFDQCRDHLGEVTPIAQHRTEYVRSIIVRERITVAANPAPSTGWSAYKVDTLFDDDFAHESQQGPDYDTAAMRCYVASRLGEEIEVPDELA